MNLVWAGTEFPATTPSAAWGVLEIENAFGREQAGSALIPATASPWPRQAESKIDTSSLLSKHRASDSDSIEWAVRLSKASSRYKCPEMASINTLVDTTKEWKVYHFTRMIESCLLEQTVNFLYILCADHQRKKQNHNWDSCLVNFIYC